MTLDNFLAAIDTAVKKIIELIFLHLHVRLPFALNTTQNFALLQPQLIFNFMM